MKLARTEPRPVIATNCNQVGVAPSRLPHISPANPGCAISGRAHQYQPLTEARTCATAKGVALNL